MTTPHVLPENIDAGARFVMLTYGRMQDNKSAYWCYVAVKPTQYDRFMEVLKGGKLDLNSFPEDGFGEILVSGPGLYPPADITKQVAKAYNTPIRDLFGDVDPHAVLDRKIKEMKANQSGSQA